MIGSRTLTASLKLGIQSSQARTSIQAALNKFMNIMVEGLAPSAMMEAKLYDLVVVGGGHVGLTAAMEAASSGLETLVVEREDGEEADGAVQSVRCCQRSTVVASRGDEEKCFSLTLLPGTRVTGVRDEGKVKVVGAEGDLSEALVWVPTSPTLQAPLPLSRTVSTRIGSLNRGPVRTCASLSGQTLLLIGNAGSAWVRSLPTLGWRRTSSTPRSRPRTSWRAGSDGYCGSGARLRRLACGGDRNLYLSLVKVVIDMSLSPAAPTADG